MRLELSPRQIEHLETFISTLLLWRARTPLISQRSPVEIIAKHVEDSFAVVHLASGRGRVADLGAGAGFPGLVIAILCERTEVLLVESKRLKATFLRDVIRQTRIANVEVLEGRVEEQEGLAGAFDLVVSRAVWPTGEFLTLARPLLGVGGLAVAMKTPRSKGVDGLRFCGYGSVQTSDYRLRGGEARVLVIAEAIAPGGAPNCST